MCTNVGEIYLLTDLLPDHPYPIIVLTTNDPTSSLTSDGLQFGFRTKAVPQLAARLRVAQDGNSILLLWEGDGEVESALTPGGPWKAIAMPTGTNQTLRLPAEGSSCYYRLSPLRPAP
jgi:hypothetical protein